MSRFDLNYWCVFVCVWLAVCIHRSRLLLSVHSDMGFFFFFLPISPSLSVESAQSSKCRPLWHSYGHNTAFTGSGFIPTLAHTCGRLVSEHFFFLFQPKKKEKRNTTTARLRVLYVFLFNWRYYMVLKRILLCLSGISGKRVMNGSSYHSPSFCSLHFLRVCFSVDAGSFLAVQLFCSFSNHLWFFKN